MNKVVILLRIYQGERGPWPPFDLAALELAGWVEDGEITPDGNVIVNEILSFIERVI